MIKDSREKLKLGFDTAFIDGTLASDSSYKPAFVYNNRFEGKTFVLTGSLDTMTRKEAEDIIEKLGVEKTYKYADNADLIIMVIDSSNKLNDEDIGLFEYIKNRNAIILLNKSDLKTVISEKDVAEYTEKKVLSISAKDETGIIELKDCLEEMFISGSIDFNDEILITNERHFNLIEQAINSIKDALNNIEMEMPEDLISIDLVNSYESLGGIIGESLENDIIDEIFSKFCMGK